MVQLPVYNTIAYCYLGDGLLLAFPNFLARLAGRDTHIMVFKVPIMLCSNSQHQASYAHCFLPIMLII